MKRPDDLDPNSIRYKFRKARFKHVERLLDEILTHKDVVTILDVGGRRNYWKLLDERFADRIQLTLLNTESDVGKEDQEDNFGLDIKTIVGDGCNMPEFADGSFDLTHSNSVIEHVGPFANMARFARETRRVGRAYYLQTPNFWFPLEPHYGVPFVHWFPGPTRISLHASLNVGFAHKVPYEQAMERVDHTKIVNRRLLREVFPDGTHTSERFALMNKSLIVYRTVSDKTS